MSYTHPVSYGNDEGWAYDEVIEVEELADLVRRDIPCKFKVLEDAWSEDMSTRTILRISDLQVI